ncbi:MAG TPA: hypothetical protein VL361_10410 [Candidatus Limnocylindrales bacterium]|jgi:hypothetical protein|nr:hypothetical protein [Candidatus Limnocylindrales bacterium]
MAQSDKKVLAAMPKLTSRQVAMLLEEVIGCLVNPLPEFRHSCDTAPPEKLVNPAISKSNLLSLS